MPTDPHLNGDKHHLTPETRLSDLEESFEVVKSLATQSVTAVSRAHDVADNARQIALELRESIANQSVRMRELESAVRRNSEATGEAMGAALLLRTDMTAVLKILGSWPSGPDDKGSGLSGRIAALGRQMGMDEQFARASSASWEQEAIEARRINDLVEARVALELQKRNANAEISPVSKKTTIPPAVKALWKKIPSGAQGIIVTLIMIGTLLWSVWQAWMLNQGK